LLGLAVGDGFGGSFFWKTDMADRIRERALPPAPWKWSDDTAMGRAIVNCLYSCGQIEPAALAGLLAEEYHREPTRGYGTIAHTILDEIWQGVSWRQAAAAVFDGKGSFGNGAAMRAAPVGAFFSYDTVRVIDEARRSAIVTHAHPEGQAGAIAVALAAAWVIETKNPEGTAMLDWVWTHMPVSETRANLKLAMDFPMDREPEEAAALLGAGEKVTAQDTVPFALWCAGRHLDSYPEALWATVAGLGDMDTTCAIVGSIVALCAEEGVPKEWLSRAESVKVASEPWWSRWEGWTRASMMAPEGASYRIRLFSAARDQDWPEVFRILAERREINIGYAINMFRPDDPSWYTLLHHAVQGDASADIVEELLVKGHLRSIRCARGERPVDLARRLERTHLIPFLEPVTKCDISARKLAVLEERFHEFIGREIGPSEGLRLPPLEVLLERGDLTMTFPVPTRFGGFVYRLQPVDLPTGFDSTKDDWVLLVKDFDRMGDTEHYHLVTVYGSVLISKGYEDGF
jgi:ADP-ribosylglycohydrolase